MAYPALLSLPSSFLSEDLLRSRIGCRGSSQADGGVANSSTAAIALEYELFAVVCHHGKHTAKGHYTCYCKARCETDATGTTGATGAECASWRSFNDTEVTAVSETEALQAKSIAYILFYRLLS